MMQYSSVPPLGWVDEELETQGRRRECQGEFLSTLMVLGGWGGGGFA